jgi:hypothetical protein
MDRVLGRRSPLGVDGQASAFLPARATTGSSGKPQTPGGLAHADPLPTGEWPPDPGPPASMAFLRSTLLPAAIVLLFGLALFAVSARIWLPGDMAAPAPIS